MTEIPNRLFDKIAIDLVTECEMSTSGNKHSLTNIDHLTGGPEVFLIPDKSADTIVSTFINEYLSVHMFPRYILSDNGSEFKNNLMDQVLKQLGIERILPAPYHPQSNGKLEVFHKYLKPTLKKLCEVDPPNWHKYINQVLGSYRVTPRLATAEVPCFGLWKGFKFTSSPTIWTYAMILGRSRFWNAELRSPQICISHCQEDFGQESFQNSTKDHGQDTTFLQDRRQSIFKKTSSPVNGILNGDLDIGLFKLSAMDTSYTFKTQATGKVWSCTVKDSNTGTTCWIVVHRHPIWQSWKIYQPPCKYTYHKSSWLIDFITHTFNTVNNWHSS